MTDEEYLNTQRRLLRLAVEIEGLDLDSFLARIAAAEAGGPALDPTLFRAGASSLAAVKRVAEAAAGVRAAYLHDPSNLLGAVMDSYSAEERARAGIV